MIDARERLRRVLFLVPYAVRHPGIPVKELAKKCDISEQDLLDDLDFLLGVGCPPFAPDDFLDLYVEGDRVFVALHQAFSRPPRFTESEAAALAAAVKALGGEGKERALRALRDAVPPDRQASFDELSERIYAGAPPAADSVLGRLQRAIAGRFEVGLRYFTPARNAESERTVRPYTLAQRFGHWYLYGHDSTRGAAIPFRLDRIRGVEVSAVRFEPPDAEALAGAQLFGSSGEAAVRIRLTERAAAWALGKPGQVRVVAREDDGHVTVELPAAGEDWATRFALSFSGEAEVLSPEPARRHFAEAVRRTLARYAA
jgi:proteasome accessory factor C